MSDAAARTVQPEPILRAERLGKRYLSGAIAVQALYEVSLQVEQGDTLAIVGASGSGKSTLLHLLGGLDTPSSGAVWLEGKQLSALSDRERSDLRNRTLGFVYQFHHLLPELSARENVALALRIRRCDKQEALYKADRLLEQVGLAERVQHRPGELSGGERQRVAIARALVTDPACILADEPTGNLDADNGERVFELLIEACVRRGAALVMVTHDPALAVRCERQLHLQSGRMQGS